MTGFINTIATAYESLSPSAPDKQIQRALLYKNYLESRSLLEGCSALLDSLSPAMADETAPATSSLTAPQFRSCVSRHRDQTIAFQLRRYVPFRIFEKRVAGLSSIELLESPNTSARQRVRVLRTAWNHWLNAEAHLLWVFAKGVHGWQSPFHLCQQLGLYGLKGYNKDEPMLLLTLEVSRVRKPDWVDAELGFYFDASPDEGDHGWTRSLRSGQRCHKEWICQPEDVVSLMDVNLMRLDESIDTLVPKSAYWDYHRQCLGGKGCV